MTEHQKIILLFLDAHLILNEPASNFQRQRAAAALELAILQPGQPLFEVRAPGFRQQQILLGMT
jgi:hypothetical protein